MKNNIILFPQFHKAIRNNELVYLFGAGISSALTDDRSCSWWQWIVNGTAKMKDRTLAAAYRNSIMADDSTGNLISVVGKVLSATKADGTYRDWMHESFETQHVTNASLADTLKKLLITRDVFATTNYDLLLEQATGLQALSYEEPDKAFTMIDQKKNDCVLHIHGLYDSARGIDNIVADQAQYDAVLNDQGAQFIQHILGTRTLIFVGCGQTTEDANISRFIQFAKNYLHMDREYYFLYKGGKEPVGIPDNIKLIPYGDEYSDLPEFLEDMAKERLQALFERNPVIGRTVNTQRADTYGLSEYHYSNEYLKFWGRKVELAQLDNFLETDRLFQWWALTGQGGAGKSRLAFEFLRRCQSRWFGFFLNFNVTENTAEQFCPFHDTLIIVDYVKSNEYRIAKTVSILIDKFKPLQYKLRILFLERDNLLMSGSWYSTLISALDVLHRSEFHDAEYNVDLTARKHRFLYLDDLDGEAVIDLIGNICEKKDLPADRSRDKKLKENYGKKFEQLKFRPLFLQIFVEAWIDNGCQAVEYANYRDLLEVVVKREQERILQILDGDVSVFNALIFLIIRALVSDGIALRELEMLYPAEWSMVRTFVKTHSLSGKQKMEYLQSVLSDTAQAVDNKEDILKPLYPDIIKEFMFLYYLDMDDMQRISEELWKNCPVEYNMFLSRCSMDFQSDEELIEFIRRASEDHSNLNAMQVRLSLLAYKIIHTIEEGTFFRKLAIDEYAYWTGVPVDDTNREIVLQGLYHSVWQFFGWSMGSKCFEAIKRIYDFECNAGLQTVKAGYLTEFAHYLVETNCVNAAQSVIKQASAVISAITDGEEKRTLQFSLWREIMVSHAYEKKWHEVRKLHTRIYNILDWEKEKQVEYYAYICFSGADLCFHMMEWGHMLTFADWLQDLAEDYGSRKRKIYFNDKVHYYYLHTKLMGTEAVSISTHLQGWGAYGLQITDSLIEEIEHNMMIADFAGLLVGAKALKVGADDNITDSEVKDYLEEADDLLEKYPDNALLAAKAIDLWKTAYLYQYQTKTPRAVIDRSYALALRFVKEKDVLREFFEMLKDSTEADNWFRYTQNKGIVDNLILNRMEEYLDPPRQKAESCIRIHKKTGANEPCPCGSGKKFKKCCRGTGKYD